MQADIYIASSITGIRRQNGVVGVVIEYKTAKGPATLTQFGTVKDATPNQAILLGMKFALSRIKPECDAVFHTDNTYVASAVEKGWYLDWKNNGWHNSKGKEIANFPEWEAVSGLLGDRVPRFEVGQDHTYKKWMQSEVKMRAAKHEKT